jgi:multimeric flavodoxin WrbA
MTSTIKAVSVVLRAKHQRGKNYGKCPIPDDLKAIFAKVEQADGVILGSPIYIGKVTGMMASFMDRS